MNAGIGETSAIAASSGLTPSSSAIIDRKVIAVCTSPKVPEIICTGRLRESSWARRSRSYDAGSSKNGRSRAAAWSITISWMRICTRSCSSC